MGFIKARERVVDCFFESGCSHWFHTDDGKPVFLCIKTVAHVENGRHCPEP